MPECNTSFVWKQSTDVEMVDAATPHTTTKKADLQSAKKAVIHHSAFVCDTSILHVDHLWTAMFLPFFVAQYSSYSWGSVYRIKDLICWQPTFWSWTIWCVCLLPFQLSKLLICFSQFSSCREGFFEGVGEIVDIRFGMDKDQRFKGFGHVEFATAEVAQEVGPCWVLALGLYNSLYLYISVLNLFADMIIIFNTHIFHFFRL